MKERIRLMEDPSFKYLQAAYLKAGHNNKRFRASVMLRIVSVLKRIRVRWAS